MKEAPLTPAQTRLWFFEQLENAAGVYTIPLAMRFIGSLDVCKLEEAIRETVTRHPSLRIRIRTARNGPRQSLMDSFSFKLEIIDLTEWPQTEREDQAFVRGITECRRSFDLENGPLFRSCLVRIASDDHLLVVPIHHIVCDGASIRIFQRDLVEFYEASISQRLPDLPVVAGDYFELACEEHSPVSQSLAAMDLAYWKDRLHGAPALLTIPSEAPRPTVSSLQGVTANHCLSEEIVQKVEALSRAERLTAFVVYSAAFHLLLGRYTGQSDIVIGFAISGRERQNARDVVGLLANLLMQRIQLIGDQSGGAFLRQVRSEILEATKHSRLRFEELLKMGSTHTLDRHPIVQAVIDYLRTPLLATTLSNGLRIKGMLLDTNTARFDLELIIRHEPNAGSVNLSLKCNADLYDRDFGSHMLHHYANLLSQLIDYPSHPCCQMRMSTDLEDNFELRQARGATKRYGLSGTLQELIVEQMLRNPDQVAVSTEREALSYGQLDRQSKRVAGVLMSLGVRTDDVVGVYASRSIKVIVVLIGILRSGAAYLPLDPEDPPDRIQVMIDTAKPKVILGTACALESLLLPDVRTLSIEEILCNISKKADDEFRPLTTQSPHSAAYVIFTSGSTGKPKGVINTHYAIRNRLFWMQEMFHLQRSDNVLQKTPLGFDVSVWEIFWPLSVGASLTLANPDGHREPAHLSTIIATRKVSVVHFVPSMLRAFLNAGWGTSLNSLRLLICSGESLSNDLVERVAECSNTEIWNLYGPTEAAIDVTAFDCRQMHKNGIVPIGRAVANTQVYVLDEGMFPAAKGLIGEIYISGVQLSRGYIGQPGLTAEQFVPSPFGPAGARMYRSGDLGRRRSDGVIEFVGRFDNQIKLRGYRIELSEIEAATNALPNVAESAAAKDSLNHENIVCFVVPKSEVNLTAAEVRAELVSKLPNYMVPAVIEITAALPHLPNGKLDRKRLVLLKPTGTRISAPPSTPAEHLLGNVWRTVLEVPTIDINESFFAAGGDSIKSIDLVSRARSAGIIITVEDVFKYPTIKELAKLARPTGEVTSDQAKPFSFVSKEVRPRLGIDFADAYPVSTLLMGLILESERSSVYRVYTTTLLLRGQFEENNFRKAVEEVTVRHPYLRTSISRRENGELLQFVHKTVTQRISVVDHRALRSNESKKRFEEWLKHERTSAFDWSAAPIFRLTVHRVSNTTFYLTLAEPYLDGWSANLVLADLLSVYEGLLRGKSVPQKSGGTAYLTFLRQERAALSNELSKQFWKDQLGDTVPGLLAKYRTNPNVSEFVRLNVPVSAELGTRLHNIATDVNKPLKSVLLAAHIHAISVISGRSEIITGLMANARPETADSLTSVGLFLNTTPIRLRIGDESWRGLIENVHAAEALTLPHRAYPYAQIVRDNPNARFIDSIFNFTHFHVYDGLNTSKHLRIVRREASDQTYFPLTVQFRLDLETKRIGLALELFGGFTSSHLRDIAKCLRESLNFLVADVEARHAWRQVQCSNVDPLSMVAPDEGLCLHQEFEMQAQRTPSNVAVTCRGEAWTYEDLRKSKDNVVKQLALHNFNFGAHIGVCLSRCPELFAILLAVLQQGACYIPLDPLMPSSRLRELAELARCDVVIVSDETVGHFDGDTKTLRLGQLVEGLEVDFDCSFARNPDAPAYMMFTSGSTGRPKLAAVSHRVVMNRLRWGWEYMPFGRREVTCFRTPIGFVDSIAEMFTGLLRGVQTFIVRDGQDHPKGLVEALANSGVTRATFVPALLSEILAQHSDLAKRLPKLRYWISSGEALTTQLAHKIMNRVPHARVINLYGSTEIGADVTVYNVRGIERGRLIPIGKPIRNVKCYVLDECGNLASKGVSGELAVGGVAVGIGYMNDAQITAARFVPDPWGPPGSRMYLTGDLVQLDPDGNLSFLGRLDRQIKIRGTRIEPVEIEAILEEEEGISSAIVLQRKEPDRIRLVAYLKLGADCEMMGDFHSQVIKLRKSLTKRLPFAWIPDLFVFVKNWPFTVSGKIDLSRLPEPEEVGDAQRRSSQPALTLTERKLEALWRKRLKVDIVYRDDDFFNLGGDSLQAMMLVPEIEKEFHAKFSVKDVFNSPCLSMMAELIERSSS